MGEVTSAASQLHLRLSDYGLRSKDIVGDGACQFRAVADQLYGRQELHSTVRVDAVAQLQANPGRYEAFAVCESFSEYLARMSQAHTWGDNLSLQAVADAYNIQACIVTTFLDRSFLTVSPENGKPSRQ